MAPRKTEPEPEALSPEGHALLQELRALRAEIKKSREVNERLQTDTAGLASAMTQVATALAGILEKLRNLPAELLRGMFTR